MICDIVQEGASVLDLGCGQGDLLLLLQKTKNARGQGIELNEEAIFKCVEKGISVFHSDIERGLSEYPRAAFDYVILNQSMQEIINVDFVLTEALRVGRHVIVGFPNFGYIRCRVRLCLFGRVPMTDALPYRWYDTPNVHFLSIRDFLEYCRLKDIHIETSRYLGKRNEVHILPNLMALNAVFLLKSLS
jgi:methionine biosynthesis protein MetW